MRFLCTIDNESQGREFSRFLTSEGIVNECEVLSVSDWGSDTYGNRYCRVWVIDEDQTAQAEAFYEEFIKDPTAPRFKEKINLIQHILEPENQKAAAREGIAKIRKAANTFQTQAIGYVTLYLMVICTIILMWETSTEIPRNLPSNLIPVAQLTAAPVTRALLYDYPKAYEIIDRLEKLYGAQVNDDVNGQSAPLGAAALIDQYNKTPIWTGVYDKAVLLLKGQKDKIDFGQPLFEKLRQGEVWRLFSPILLHAGLLHLFFNMIWLLVIGKQMEQRLGAGRYIIFILITAAFSNTMQYLMSGPNFVGISGVLTAMLGFIYVRQQIAAWEGYQLQRSTLGFLTFYILAVLGIQVISFISEIYWNISLASPIANTAHIAGAALGYLLGKLDFFAWKKI